MVCNKDATVIAVLAALASGSTVLAQSAPVNGMRPSDVRWDAIAHATVYPTPSQRIDDATILMRDGWIEAVGASSAITIPTGATIHDGKGLVITAGFIEPSLLVDSSVLAKKVASDAGAYWNPNVTPQVSVENLPAITTGLREELRALGFAVAAAYPDTGIVRGSGCVLLLGDAPSGYRTIGEGAGQIFSLGRREREWRPGPTGPDEDRAPIYPNSLMGTMALLRQTLLDTRWRADSVAAWQSHPEGNDPPVAAEALDSLVRVIGGKERVLFDASSESDVLRAGALLKEFSLKAAILGSGSEYRNLSEVVALQVPLIVPVEFPRPPDLSSPRLSESVSLSDLKSWAVAPSNVSRLLAAGASVSLTTTRLKKRDDFPARVREARSAGLSESQLIAALTTTPAELLGVSETLGTIAPGRMANLTVSDGPLFAEDSRIVEVWIAGRAYDTAAHGEPSFRDAFKLPGRFAITLADGAKREIRIDSKKRAITFDWTKEDGAKQSVGATHVALERLRGGFLVEGGALGLSGPVRCALRVDDDRIALETLSETGLAMSFTATAVPTDPAAKPDADQPRPAHATRPEVPTTFPFGDFGSASIPAREHVIFRGATVWTSASGGILENTDVIVRDGVIVEIGGDLPAPPTARVVDCAGRHLTPGLIDCHSHTGIDGSVNEWTQACTSEVRINDVIDPTDVGWYRELAGGLTCANQLHGSANPIGGQNSVVKLKWGSPVSDWPAQTAKPGIKFALGENVVRPTGRYPQTRMGVEAFLRDQFRAALEYRLAQREFAASPDGKMPPRVDLELEALAEILEGKRVIHCHSYRQDEILMLIRLADELGFRIATFQHILEGYKVADEIARHGAGGSCFSDWWAYKMEVMDAIPWDGAMMHNQGVLMSFNSDSDELARHLNTEAAKAVKYGNLPPARALEFVTINPAKQLGIGDRTGSIEIGKDADLVLWSGDPLSPLTICEQTWVEGTKRFDRLDDLANRPAREALRQQLLTAVYQSKDRAKDTPTPTEKNPAKEPADTPAPKPTRLMQQMMTTSDEMLLDLWRRGIDARTMHRAGDCGCSEVSQ